LSTLKKPIADAAQRRTFFTTEIPRLFDTWLRRCWIPLGFFCLLSGFFWMPNDHLYKVWLPYLLILPCLLATILLQKWSNLKYESTLLLVLIYLSYMVGVALIMTDDRSEAVAYAKWSFYILVFLFGVGRQMQISASALTTLLCWSVVVAGLASALALAKDWQNGLLMDPNYRLVGVGTLYNPLLSGNLFGAFVVIGGWCGLAAPRYRSFIWPAVAACFIATVFTGSRSPLVALTAIACWIVIVELRGRQRWLGVFYLALTVSLVVLLFGQRLGERGMSLRPEVWQNVLQQIQTHSWLGAGLTADVIVSLPSNLTFYEPHNIFLAALYHGGAIGLILFLLLFVGTPVRAWRLRKVHPLHSLAAALQLYGIVALQFDGGNLIGRPGYFWMYYWVPVALHVYAKRQSKSTSAPSALNQQPSEAPVLPKTNFASGMPVINHQILGRQSFAYFNNARSDMVVFIPTNVGTVLEIGCGTGEFSRKIQEEFGAEVWGVEPNLAASSQAQKSLHRVLPGSIETHLDDLPNQYFDCICMNDVIEHLLDPWDVLARLRAKLSTDGVLVASIPNVRHYKNLKSLVFDGEWTYTDSGTLDRTHLRFFTPNSMRQLFADSGYQVVQLHGIRGSRKMKARVWRYLSLGKLWDIAYPQFAVVARPVRGS